MKPARPLVFSADMVRALRCGQKRQTRRIMPDPPANHRAVGDGAAGLWWVHEETGCATSRVVMSEASGDLIWVREAFSGMKVPAGARPPRDWGPRVPIWFWADGQPLQGEWTEPQRALDLPRLHSRMTLAVEAVRVDRLRNITPADACAEGWPIDDPNAGEPLEWFAMLWDTIHQAPEKRWAADPWVKVLTFSKIDANIDDIHIAGTAKAPFVRPGSLPHRPEAG